MASFLYRDLEFPASMIRLVTISPGESSNEIQCSLKHVELSTQPEYEALSYVWGDPTKLAPIVLDHLDFQVTVNLEFALRHLRKQEEDRTMWIDSICINQQNDDERSSQVLRMGDIYRQAKRVVVWLGLATEDTPQAFEILVSLADAITMDWLKQDVQPVSDEHVDLADRSIPLLYEDAEWSALQTIFNRSWFERLWVRQEILLATDAIILCGFSAIPWQSFRKSVFCIYNKDRENCDAGLWDGLEHLEALVNYRAFDPLGYLIYRARHCKCTDPRDRVYALLSLMRENERKVFDLKPDYTKSVGQVYKDVATIYAKAFNDLDLLRFCDIGKRKTMAGFPTWAADWSCLDDVTDTLWESNAHGNSSGCFHFSENGTLHAKGLQVATVVAAKEFTVHANSHYDEAIAELRHIAPTDIQQRQYPNGGTLVEAYCRTFVVDDFGDRWDPPTQTIVEETARKALLDLLTHCPLEQSEDLTNNSDITNYLNHFSWYCQRRAFITTREGYIGLAPPATQPSDIVAVLLGCASPLVLRPADSHPCVYRLVGGCYLDSIMSGEAFLGPLPKNYKSVSKLHGESGYYRPAFRDVLSYRTTFEDPRYEQLLGSGYQERVKCEGSANERDRAQALIMEVLRVKSMELTWFNIV